MNQVPVCWFTHQMSLVPARDSVQASHVVGRNPVTWTVTTALKLELAGRWRIEFKYSNMEHRHFPFFFFLSFSLSLSLPCFIPFFPIPPSFLVIPCCYSFLLFSTYLKETEGPRQAHLPSTGSHSECLEPKKGAGRSV